VLISAADLPRFLTASGAGGEAEAEAAQEALPAGEG
jgi:hypothetical protein